MRSQILFVFIHLSVSNPCHRSTMSSFFGYMCDPKDQSMYHNIAYHHCKIMCQASSCQFIDFDASSGRCVIGNQVCIAVPATDTQRLDVFNSGNTDCLAWLPYTIDPPLVGLVSMLTGRRQQYIARIHQGKGIIPAKIHPNFRHSLFSSVGTDVIRVYDAHTKGGVEVLSIADCSALTWKKVVDTVLPDGAVEGGCTADGTKLYVGKMTVVLDTGSLSPIYGYYNPSTGKGHGEEVGVQIVDDVEVLVLL